MAQDIQGDPFSFNQVVVRSIGEVSSKAINGDNKGFMQGVEVLRDLMDGFVDDKYTSAFVVGWETSIEGLENSPREFILAKFKFRQLIKLACRSGFVPAKVEEGIYSENAIFTILHEIGHSGKAGRVKNIGDKKQNKKT